MLFQLTIDAFASGRTIPKRHTCDGDDLSPAMSWSEEPAGTRSFALIMDDPDAPGGVWNHWLLYDVPADVHGLPEGFRSGKTGTSGKNSFGRPGYGGPCPPRGHGAHRYYFKLFALDLPSLHLSPGADRNALDRAMRGHILAEVAHMGRYERR
jgi:Raf kinase inhibitor-like YbhB/YbcL family protein